MAVSPPQQFGASVNRHTPKNAIGRITPTGEVTEYPVNLGPPTGITSGPDGNMWFTAGNKIGKISLVGAITEYPLPDGGSGGDAFSGEGIAAGPDGNVWFTESGASPARTGSGGSPLTAPSPSTRDPRPPVVKTPCPVDVTLHKPVPKTVGSRVLTDSITTNTSACALREPVVLCRPLSRTAAGKKGS